MSTISDIARLAGVSTGTVSKVLNNDSTVKDKNRERVLNAMKELDYQPNLYARNLSRGKTGLVSIIIPTIGQEFQARLVNSIDSLLSKYGYDSILFPMLSRERLSRFSDPFHYLYHTDGMIIASLSLQGLFGSKGLPVTKPLMMVDTHDEIHDCVYIDNRLGGLMAAEKLQITPASKVFIVGGYESDEQFSSRVFEDRVEGFLEGIELRGIPRESVEQIPIILEWELAYKKGFELSTLYSDFSVFCLSDILARGFIEGASANKKLAGIDYSLIGFDNLEFSEALGISTIAQPVEKMGEFAAMRIIEAIEAPSMVRSAEVLLPEYVERKSNRRES